MFTKANPCASDEDLQAFFVWWQQFTGINGEQFMQELAELREFVQSSELTIQAAAESGRFLSLSENERRAIGILQHHLVPKRAQLLEKERSNPYVQPEMILAVPGAHGFWFGPHEFGFETECLYGRDARVNYSPWCMLGRLQIWFRSEMSDGKLVLKTNWKNLDGGHFVTTSQSSLVSVVPAPQVDAGGTRGCMGDVTPGFVVKGRASGRIDAIVSSLIRYTECPHPHAEKGRGMGNFPPVPDTEVPEFYLRAFPR
jgi:hypothetical protein